MRVMTLTETELEDHINEGRLVFLDMMLKQTEITAEQHNIMVHQYHMQYTRIGRIKQRIREFLGISSDTSEDCYAITVVKRLPY